ncbi:hypothetical protein [Metabacillus arenae]|uniref:Uncharacterized protein n=1 Tax=Metabacillus arenae TaxID=2771434 RepID=A0A926RX81_9BACI|nr:hypothetical protein [Metabacillus arenae]MBD1380390.1 hypothetical protein [Metabacillus arenae]
MYIVATFSYSSTLEIFLKEIEENGFTKQQILVIPLSEVKGSNSKLPNSPGVGFIDLAAVFGSIFMLLGTIYGLNLRLGPIAWGSFGLIFGILLGVFLVFIIKKMKTKKPHHTSKGEVVVMIHCSKDMLQIIEPILWNHDVLAVGKLNKS